MRRWLRLARDSCVTGAGSSAATGAHSRQLAFRLKFAFYPMLALGACGWLAWDWTHDRSLNSAEDAIFDRVIQWRPIEPRPSGRVAVVEIDDCSIEYFRARGEGGWPWSRQRHADLLDELDRAGVRAVAYDVLFADASTSDPLGDESLEAMARGGAGRFLFGSTRLHPDYDAGASLPASQVAGRVSAEASRRGRPDRGAAGPVRRRPCLRYSAIMNVTRNVDGVLRDIPLRVEVRRLGPAIAALAPRDDGAHRGRRATIPPRYGRTGGATRGCRR